MSMGDGSVHDARGSGLGNTGACAARVLPEIYFKAIGGYKPIHIDEQKQ